VLLGTLRVCYACTSIVETLPNLKAGCISIILNLAIALRLVLVQDVCQPMGCLVLGDETFGHTQSGYIVMLYIIRQARSLIRVLSLREICIE
jgi:hypothetical protein